MTVAIALAIAGGVATAGLAVLARVYYVRMAALEQEGERYRQEHEERESLLERIGSCINTSLDLEGALEVITRHIVEASDAAAGACYLVEPGGENLRARAVIGLFPPMRLTSEHVLTKRKYLANLIKSVPIAIGEGVIGFVARSGEAVLITEGLTDPRVPKVATDFLQINTMIAAPLRLQQRTLGVLAVVNKRGQVAFDDHDLHLLQTLADQAALTVDLVKLYEQLAERQRFEQELRLAHEFQQMMLPHRFPDVPGLDIAALTRPAREVGGDYFDFINVDESHIGVAIVDVSGKGIPGALVMATVRSTLRAEAAHELSPKEVLLRVNRRLLEDTKNNVFITMLYGIIDLQTRRVRFVRAGHEPLITWNRHNGEPHLHRPQGIALGLVGDDLFNVLEECEVDLLPGDVAVLYTDGAIEAQDARSTEYGLERFLSRLREHPERSSDDRIRSVLEDIQSFAGDVPQTDDITLVTVRVRD